MGAALLPLAIASTAFSAIGDIQKGIAGQNAANYNAEVARQNAIHAVEVGQVKAMNVGLRAAATGGRIKAAQAANNVNVNTGSAVAVQQGQREAGAVDQANTSNDALTQAYGYQAQSNLDKYQGKAAIAEGITGALGDIAGGASKWGGGLGDSSSTASPLGQSLQNSAGTGGGNFMGVDQLGPGGPDVGYS